MDRSKVTKLVILIVGILAGRFLYDHFSGGHSSTDRIQAAMTAELDRQGLMPLLRQRVRGVTDPDAARKLGADLSRKGISRLSNEQLATREGLLLHLDSIAGDTLCAGHFMGNLTPTQLHDFIGLLDSPRLATWASLSATAMKAELDATTPVVPLTQDEVAGVLQAIAAQVPPADHDRYVQIFSTLGAATLQDQCWVSKVTTATALGMPSPQREEVLRKMAIVETGS